MVMQMCCLFFFMSCSNDDHRAQQLNDKAYYYHYRSLDTVAIYADSVLRMPHISDATKAEALNNLIFYNIGRMRYSVADSLVREVYSTTDNHTELCIASIQMMRMCQRRSANKAFYEYRQKAKQHFRRIYEDQNHYNTRTPKEQHANKRLIYAESEYRLVMSVYDYYAGQIDSAANMLHEIDSIPYLKQDTVQYVAYLYNIGSGGILTKGSKEDIRHQELECLMQCYVISADEGYTYWKANALQSLSEYLLDNEAKKLPDLTLAERYLNIQNVPDSLLAGTIAEQSLALFQTYGDLYQEAASWRTLAYCYSNIGDYPGAIYSLDHALKVDTAINSVPALKASIHEQFSIAFSALNLKQNSDYHRNLYLDLYENTRQDRELEVRIEQLNQQVAYLDTLIYIIIGVIIFLISYLVFLVVKRRRMHSKGKKTSSVAVLLTERKEKLEALQEQLETLQENCAMKSLELSRQQDTYAEQRAKMHLINSLAPLIDRMLHETKCLCDKQEPADVRESRCEYISELLIRINEQNNFLTEWIQMKKGELSLRIESFPISSLFSIIAANTSSLRRKGLTLDVQPSELFLKADRTLTLFMLNTLCDNARKYTPEGGRITVSAIEVDDDMVEISVSDTGQGMTAEQQRNIFEVKPITDEVISSDGTAAVDQKSHGFGLLNSKGIIEKYKKTNSLFAKCTIGVESSLGKGSRFFFRLPKGIQKAVVAILMLLMHTSAVVASTPSAVDHSLADSIYTCNIQGRYADVIIFARQYLHQVNANHMAHYANTDTLMLNDSILAVSAEVRWLHEGHNADYQVLLSVRNEIAVAALALHDWQLYHYNNNVYTQLYKDLSVDPSLAEYHKRMASTEFNSHVAVMVLILLILLLIPIYYFVYYRHVILDARRELNRMFINIKNILHQCHQQQEQLDRLSYEHDRLHVLNNVMNNSFSAIKHETMYYPSRLQQLLLDVETNATELDDVARYYRSVFGMLSSQAQYNCRYQLPANVLFDLMKRLMAQLSGLRKADITPERHETYDTYTFTLRDSRNLNEQKARLMILTLIVRDLGETYDMRRCGVENTDGEIKVTVPHI